jgi:inorganic pyrophosphatase
MPISTLLKKTEKFEIKKYKKPKDHKTIVETHIPYSGSPHKHPYDNEKMVLVIDPYYTNNFYYEFNKSDISYIEELPNLVNLEGEIFTIVRIWIKKMSIAVRCTPFIVGDI